MPVRLVLTVMTTAMMIVIFCLSMEPAEKSDETSGILSRKVISVVYPEYERYPIEKQQSLYEHVQHLVRKSAHYIEYMTLGILLRLCTESWIGKKKGVTWISWGIGALYAATDELHQLAIDGRSGQWTDVLLDSSGVLTGVLISTGVLFLVRRRQKRRNLAEWG